MSYASYCSLTSLLVLHSSQTVMPSAASSELRVSQAALATREQHLGQLLAEREAMVREGEQWVAQQQARLQAERAASRPASATGQPQPQASQLTEPAGLRKS